MQIQCIETETDFLSLRDEWTDLWGRSVQRSYFLTHDWMRCCWRELNLSNQMRIFIVRDGARPVLIAPLMRSRRRHNKIPANYLTFIEHPETQIADMIVDAETDGEAAFSTFIRYLLEERSEEWNVLLLDKIPNDSNTMQFLDALRESVPVDWKVQPSHEALVISLGRRWDEYLSAQSVRFRKTLRNVANRIQRLGQIEIKCYQGKGSWIGAIEKLFSVSDASWKVSNGVAITSSAERMCFFKELLRGESTAASLRILILQANGIPIASETQVVDGAKVYALRSDYDERYSDSSPGTYLQMEILKELFASTATQYNLGVGLNAYKMRWAEERSGLMKFQMYNDNFYSRMLRSADRVHFSRFRALPGLRMINQLFTGKTS